MMAAERTAEVTWKGSLLEGRGTIDRVSSEAFGPLEVTWAARTETEHGGLTSPEELIAAAHASCFSMALSHALAQAGAPPDELRTTATVSFVPGEGITKIVLFARGDVPGLDDAGFREFAEQAKENCPVSKALAGGTAEIELDTHSSVRS
jgi:osmotically inducible protein OsmC